MEKLKEMMNRVSHSDLDCELEIFWSQKVCKSLSLTVSVCVCVCFLLGSWHTLAINVLIDGVKKSAAGEMVKMDDWATRYPTLGDDVARVIQQLACQFNQIFQSPSTSHLWYLF